MKRIVYLLALLSVLASPVFAQDQPATRYVFGGAGYFAPAIPAFQGFIGAAIPIGLDGKMFSYTDADFSIVKTGGQFTIAGQHLSYSIKTGVGYVFFAKKGWSAFGLGAPGVQTDGNFTSATIAYGLGIHKYLYKDVLGLVIPFTAETHKDFDSGQVITNFAPRIGLTVKF
jgi:hypothetical protein